MSYKFETLCLLGLSGYLSYFAYYNISPKQSIAPNAAVIAPQQAVIAPEKENKGDTAETVISPLARQDEPPKRLAPEGVFYLITAKSKEFESGVVSYRVGTPVTKTKPGKIRVPDGTILDAKDEEISNDLDLVSFVSSIKNAPVVAETNIKEEEPAVVPPLAEREKTSQPVYSSPLNEGARDKIDFGQKSSSGKRKSFVK